MRVPRKNAPPCLIDSSCLGLAVFPLKPRDKRPANHNGFKAATTDLKQIDEINNKTLDMRINACCNINMIRKGDKADANDSKANGQTAKG